MSAKKSFLLRLPHELWDELNVWAQDELRSVNGQIEYVLRQALKQRRRIAEESEDSPSGRRARKGPQGG